jgi:hypothetical protein
MTECAFIFFRSWERYSIFTRPSIMMNKSHSCPRATWHPHPNGRNCHDAEVNQIVLYFEMGRFFDRKLLRLFPNQKRISRRRLGCLMRFMNFDPRP